ncbi:MAG: 4-hydroxy-3-methylbut-2-enyl diphosphate reductase [Balneolales bacterium]
MAKKFDIPLIYKSSIIARVKEANQVLDPMKKDLAPSVLDFGAVRFLIPRHFGFCYGVENAIDIAYRSVEQNPGKNIYLLSEMIHNPTVNNDLQKRGVRFLFETGGKEIIPISSLNKEDIVIVPAFGTTMDIQEKLAAQGIDAYQYDTTCPFVVKVWKRGKQLGINGNSLVIHGKHKHEETRATFSHTAEKAPAVVVLNPKEAQTLADIMLEKKPLEDFEQYFGHKSTSGFNPLTDLEKFGVINQTTMLASETRQVMDILKQAAIEKHGEAEVQEHFADTADTLCYATNENQSATLGLLKKEADLALVVGGYNSSNTMHLVELLEGKYPTYHVRDASEIKSPEEIHHFNQWDKQTKQSLSWLSQTNNPVTIALTSGASCPDALVDEVILKVISYFDGCREVEEALKPFEGDW